MMKKTFLTACMSFAFLAASAQTNSYIVKTKGATKSAQNHMADVIAEVKEEDEESSKDFISQNFRYQSLCDWEEGMKFMVMPEKLDLVVKTFTDAATGKNVSNLKLKYKIMIYKGHSEGKDGRAQIDFLCQDDGKNYYSPWSATLNSPTLPAGTAFTKVAAGSRSFAAQWKKQANATGYQIEYSTKSNFSGSKKVTVKSNKTLKTTVKKLSAKKVYYVRIRTYKTISKVNYFSTWSKAVKVKTK